MTGRDLLETVTLMGFAKTIEDNRAYFYRAANLSLSRISRSFARLGTLTLPTGEGHLDLSEEAEDFLSLPASPLSVESEREGADCTLLREGRDFAVRGSRITFLHRIPVPVTVHYIRRASPLSEDTLDEELDVHPMAESLLPLLTASYLWLDDRGDLATHYLAMYRTEAEELRRLLYHHGCVSVKTNGWDTP